MPNAQIGPISAPPGATNVVVILFGANEEIVNASNGDLLTDSAANRVLASISATESYSGSGTYWATAPSSVPVGVFTPISFLFTSPATFAYLGTGANYVVFAPPSPTPTPTPTPTPAPNLGYVYVARTGPITGAPSGVTLAVPIIRKLYGNANDPTTLSPPSPFTAPTTGAAWAPDPNSDGGFSFVFNDSNPLSSGGYYQVVAAVGYAGGTFDELTVPVTLVPLTAYFYSPGATSAQVVNMLPAPSQGTPIAAAGGQQGLWACLFSDTSLPAPSGYSFNWTSDASSPYNAGSGSLAITSTPQGYYAGYYDLLSWAGSTNLTVYADLNNTGTANYPQMQYFLNQADAWINNTMYHANGGPINGNLSPFPVIPLPTNDPDFPRFNQAAAEWTVAMLYMKRGVQDKGSDPDGQFQKALDDATSIVGALVMRRQQEGAGGLVAFPGPNTPVQPYPRSPFYGPNGRICGGGWGFGTGSGYGW